MEALNPINQASPFLSTSNVTALFQKHIQPTLEKIDTVQKSIFTPATKAALKIGKSVIDHARSFVTQIAYISKNTSFMRGMTCINLANTLVSATSIPKALYKSANRIKVLYEAIKVGDIEQAFESTFKLTGVTANIVNTAASIGRALLTLKAIGIQNLQWLTILSGVGVGLSAIFVIRDITHTVQTQYIQHVFKNTVTTDPNKLTLLHSQQLELKNTYQQLENDIKILETFSAEIQSNPDPNIDIENNKRVLDATKESLKYFRENLGQTQQKLKDNENALIDEEFKAKREFIRVLGPKKVKKHFKTNLKKMDERLDAIDKLAQEQIKSANDPTARRAAIELLNQRLAATKWFKLADSVINVVALAGAILSFTPGAAGAPVILGVGIAGSFAKMGANIYVDHKLDKRFEKLAFPQGPPGSESIDISEAKVPNDLAQEPLAFGEG
jgi:hypothetical protein